MPYTPYLDSNTFTSLPLLESYSILRSCILWMRMTARVRESPLAARKIVECGECGNDARRVARDERMQIAMSSR